jgi:hypothetical protein
LCLETVVSPSRGPDGSTVALRGYLHSGGGCRGDDCRNGGDGGHGTVTDARALRGSGDGQQLVCCRIGRCGC